MAGAQDNNQFEAHDKKRCEEQQSRILTELKSACESALVQWVTLRVPHGNLLAGLVEHIVREGLHVCDHWDESVDVPYEDSDGEPLSDLDLGYEDDVDSDSLDGSTPF